MLLARADADYDRIKSLMRAAYELGRVDARLELTSTLEAMQVHISRLLGVSGPVAAPAPEERPDEIEGASPKGEKPRAKRGSVRPAVLDLLRRLPPGPTVKDVFTHNNKVGSFVIAEPSIRSTLGDLRKDGLVDKRGERWFLIEKEKGPSEPEPSSIPETSVSTKSEDTRKPASHSESSLSGPSGPGPVHRVRSDLLSGTASFAPFNPKLPSLRG